MLTRIAAVSFLNTIPLIEWFRQKEQTGLVQLDFALPSELPPLLVDGRADVALLPIVEVFRGQSGGMLPGTGIACQGAVDSVKLFSLVEPKRLGRIIVDRGSRSSVALLRILLAEMHGIEPEFVEAEPSASVMDIDADAILIIGDRCFEFEAALKRSGRDRYRKHDLGELWWNLTGLPFVFAVWAVAPDLPERLEPTGIAAITNLLSRARDYGLANLERLARREAAAGRLGVRGEATADAIGYYYGHSLCYRLDDRHLAGIERFHQLCNQHGLAPAGSRPPIL